MDVTNTRRIFYQTTAGTKSQTFLLSNEFTQKIIFSII